MLQFFMMLLILLGCTGEEESQLASSTTSNEESETKSSDIRNRDRSRDLIITMEFAHDESLKSSELWVGEPIAVEFGEILPQSINLHVEKGHAVEKHLNPKKGRAVAKLRFARGKVEDSKRHGFKDAEGRHWALTSVSEAKDIPREITLLVKLRKPRVDQGQRIWKGDMLKVEKGQFLKQRFVLSVSEGNDFDKTLATKYAPLVARISFKRVMNQSKTSNGFIDRVYRVWEIAQVELVR